MRGIFARVVEVILKKLIHTLKIKNCIMLDLVEQVECHRTPSSAKRIAKQPLGDGGCHIYMPKNRYHLGVNLFRKLYQF